MKLKIIEVDGNTYAEVQDGKPVYTGDDGKDIAFDAVGTKATIERITDESKRYKERAQKAEGDNKAFEGIEDPKKAIEALKTVANLDDKKLIDAGEVEKVKAELTKGFEAKLAEKDEENGKLKSTLNKEMIGGSFSRSKFIGDKIAVPTDIIESRFGNQFKIEEGKVVAYDQAGNQIYSKAKPGELAGFDEALETLVDQYPYKDQILKGNGGQGSGAQNSNGGAGKKTMPLADFNALPAKDRAAKMAEPGFQVTE